MGMAEHQPPTAGPPGVAVVGPTAAGKTALSLELAQALDGEVVNAMPEWEDVAAAAAALGRPAKLVLRDAHALARALGR